MDINRLKELAGLKEPEELNEAVNNKQSLVNYVNLAKRTKDGWNMNNNNLKIGKDTLKKSIDEFSDSDLKTLNKMIDKANKMNDALVDFVSGDLADFIDDTPL